MSYLLHVQAGMNFLVVLMNSIYLAVAMQKPPTGFAFVSMGLIVVFSALLLSSIRNIFKEN